MQTPPFCQRARLWAAGINHTTLPVVALGFLAAFDQSLVAQPAAPALPLVAPPFVVLAPCSGFGIPISPGPVQQSPFAAGALSFSNFAVLDTGQAQTNLVCMDAHALSDGSVSVRFSSWVNVSAATSWHIGLTVSGGVTTTGLAVAGSLATVNETLTGSSGQLAAFSQGSETSTTAPFGASVSPLMVSADVGLSGVGFVDFTMTFVPVPVRLRVEAFSSGGTSLGAVVVADGDANDTCSQARCVTYFGPVPGGWVISISTTIAGFPSPVIDLNSAEVATSGAGNLEITASAGSLSAGSDGPLPVTASLGGTLQGLGAVFQAWVNPANTAPADGSVPTGSVAIWPPPGFAPSASSISVMASSTFQKAGPFSAFAKATISAPAPGQVSFDLSLDVPVAQTDTIIVTTNLSSASFTISGPQTYLGGGTSFSQPNAPAGTYTIAFAAVPGYITPASQNRTLTAGGSISFTGIYQTLPTNPTTAALGGPSPRNSNPFAAEPVNTATGNYYSSNIDLAAPGKGLALVFTRSYNSADAYSGPLGIGWTHSFNLVLLQNANNSVSIKEGDGGIIGFTPSGGNGYAAATLGVFDTLKKNNDGSFTLTRKNQIQLTFSGGGQLVSIVDRNGNTQVLSYDGLGNLTTITDSASRLFSLSYDGNSHLVKITDPLNRSLQYGYDASGRLTSFQDATGATTSYVYDSSNRLTSATDPRGNVYLQNSYDSQSRVIAQKNARNFTTTFAYNTPSAGTTTITDPLGNVTKHVLDASGRLSQQIDALGGTTSYTYGSSNLKLSVTDPLGHAQSFTYDASGNILSMTDAAGKTSFFTYDSKNSLMSSTDRLGRTTTFSYDSKSNLLTTVDPSGGTSTFTYDGFGELLTAQNPLGFTTSFQYDSSGNQIKIIDALGSTVTTTHDAVGRATAIQNQLGKTTTKTYDANNRPLTVTDPLSNSTQNLYDANGNLTKLTDANGKITQYTYDATNKLSQVTNAQGGITQYQYDGNTNLTTTTDANGHTTAYAYDALQRRRSTTDPLGRQKQFVYDAAGNVSSTIDGNGKTNTFTYDPLNRLNSMVLSDGKTVGYTYDSSGNRLTMADWRGTTTYTYDILNRATSVQTPDSATVRYAYDAAGNRTRLTYPDGKIVQYTYDAINRLSKATDWAVKATTYTYDTAGNLTGLSHPNGANSSYQYDGANRLLSVINRSGSSTLSSFTYGLDKVGNRVQMTTSANGVNNYGYDGLYRLTSWTPPSGQATTWTYDPVGNRNKMVSSAGTTNYSYDAADELLSAGTTTFSYDGNGSQLTKTTSSTTLSYGWDALNRLISVAGGTTNTQYKYDGDGNRVFQQVSSGTYAYINDTALRLPVVLSETGPDGSIAYAYGNSLVSVTSSGFQYYHQFDGLGSTTNLTDSTGAQKANYAYDPWGKLTLPLDPVGNKDKYKFTGEAVDSSTGLMYLRARSYDPAIGRFLSRDRLDSRRAGQHQYAYAQSNPVVLRDPSGLSVEPVGMVLGASTSISTPDSLLNPSNLPSNTPIPTLPGAWQYYCNLGVCYKARQIKNWSDLSGWEQAKLVWRDLIESYSILPSGEPGTPLDYIQLLESDDPRYEIDPNSFVPAINGPNGLPIDLNKLPKA
jgi:RHS repeat-associated protein